MSHQSIQKQGMYWEMMIFDHNAQNLWATVTDKYMNEWENKKQN